MEKEFIDFKLALELEKLGFDEECFGYYVNTELDLTWKFSDCSLYQNTHDSTLAPLYQQAFRWFREKYNLNSFIIDSKSYNWYFNINDMIKDDVVSEVLYFKTYEEVELECLKKLIEIVKNK